MTKDMTQSSLDLSKLFAAVTETLSENQSSLNKADSYNSNHGDNMVDIFKTITEAVGKKEKSDAGSALAYASEVLTKEHSSGSATAYAEGLRQAAEAFKSKQVTQGNAFEFIRTLLGGGEVSVFDPSEVADDFLGNLMANLGDVQQDAQAAGLDLEDLLSVAMAFFQAQQGGDSAIESLIEAVVSGGALGKSTHRSKSGQLVGSTLMKILGALGG
jgi:hypothetical protein